MTPNIQFQPNRIFIRNDLFEGIIKSCKATNVEFLMLKEKLGLRPCEVICDKKEFILMLERQHDFGQLRKENKESMKIKGPKVLAEKAIEIKSPEEDEKTIEIKSPEEDENTTDWYDKNKFKKILTIVNSNKFDHKNKISKLNYNGIKFLIDNINKNTISEILAKKI